MAAASMTTWLNSCFTVRPVNDFSDGGRAGFQDFSIEFLIVQVDLSPTRLKTINTPRQHLARQHYTNGSDCETLGKGAG